MRGGFYYTFFPNLQKIPYLRGGFIKGGGGIIKQKVITKYPPPSVKIRPNEGGVYLAPFTFPLQHLGSASPIRKLRGGLLKGGFS